MGPLFIILAHHVVGEERLARTGGSEYKFIPIRDCTVLHRQVGNTQMDWLARQPVHHADAERR